MSHLGCPYLGCPYLGCPIKSLRVFSRDVPKGCPKGMSPRECPIGMSKEVPLGPHKSKFFKPQKWFDLESKRGCPNFEVTVLSNQRGYKALVGTAEISRIQRIIPYGYKIPQSQGTHCSPRAKNAHQVSVGPGIFRYADLPRSQRQYELAEGKQMDYALRRRSW